MDIQELQRNWDAYGKSDPLWAVLTYEGKAGNRWDEAEFFETGLREIADLLVYLKPKNVNIPDGPVLDFGCAVGRLTQALCKHFPEVVGVDIAPSMLELANQFNKYPDGCRYVLNTVDNLSQFGDAEFAFVVSMITLQHVEPRYSHKYIQEFLRILKPGGVLVFQLPSHATPEYLRRQRMKKFIPTGLLGLYRRLRHKMPATETRGDEPTMEMYGTRQEKVNTLLEGAGGRVVDVEQDSHAGNWISYRYCVVKSG
ncbi:MAG: class I SAM-dependent methyltransferase [Chthonomonadales bacterium]